MRTILLICCLLATSAPVPPHEAKVAQSRPGVLLMAHGGAPQWNERVLTLAAAVGREWPVEVAFGMASRSSLQAGITRLQEQGVLEIVAVPLFISSWSSVITSTEYLLGLRKDAPGDLAIFAKMPHSAHGASGTFHAHGQPAADPASPVIRTVPVRMTSALNRHPLVGEILADRAKAISTVPKDEAVILVAHGPVPDDDNRRWLEDMAVLAKHVSASAPYGAVHYLTLRDDAGRERREEATRELRRLVEAEAAAGRRVHIVPHLLSFGGIERGIHTRLEGLSYTMAEQGLMPDERLITWVRHQIVDAH